MRTPMAFRVTSTSVRFKEPAHRSGPVRASFASGVVLAKAKDTCLTISTPEAFDSFLESSMGELHPMSPKRDRSCASTTPPPSTPIWTRPAA